MHPIYLDYAATTPVDPRVVEKLQQYLTIDGCFGNPASNTHAYGWQANAAVDTAREQVANLIKADQDEIIWTSGATESNNIAIKGVAEFYQRKGKHIVSCATEHKSVLDPLAHLEEQGYEVTLIKPEKSGLIDIKKFEAALRDDTTLVSIMLVNNETGVIQNIKEMTALTRSRGIFFHCDAAQAAGKIKIDVNDLDVDLMSFSGHKIYAPKGVGALYVRQQPRVRLFAQTHGGGHERGMRSGTLATHQIVAMGEAFRIAKEELQTESARLTKYRKQLWKAIDAIGEVYLNGDPAHSVPCILNISFNYVEGESLLVALEELAISTGSACTSASIEPSHVLTAMGIDAELAHSALRFSIGRFTTEKDIKKVIEVVTRSVQKLRELNPLWSQ